MVLRTLAPALVGGMTLLLSGCEPRPTRATIEGDWVHRAWRYGAFAGPAIAADRVFSFRGDSVLGSGEHGAAWAPYRLRGSLLTIPGAGTFTAAFSADTLILTVPGGARAAFVRLPPATVVPRPERIAFSRHWCSWGGPASSCPKFDFEIDSAGTLHYERHDSWDRSTQYVVEGRRALYDRLSVLAAASRADTVGLRMGGSLHDYWIALALWYGGRRHVHEGTRMWAGPLDLLILEIEGSVKYEPLRPDSTPYLFDTRSFVDPPVPPPPPGTY